MNDETQNQDDGSLLAAVDLGSNSFHLIIARTEHGEMRPVEALSEKVQLGAGLRHGMLSPEAMERGLACLTRFAQLLDQVAPERLRVVGTNALRVAKNRHSFTSRASRILGAGVDIVYGREEARLVYLGVAHTLADDAQSRLVVDIGGGSTEFIIGERFEPRRLESLQMGCVSFGQACFADGKITKSSYRDAYQRARIEVSHIRHHFHSGRWEDCVGSSGTLRAIEAILRECGWVEQGITRDGLKKLQKRLLRFEHMDDITLPGLAEQRRGVILPGVAITCALFDELDVETMRTSPGALREGVLYDLIGRLSHEDVRERTVNALMQRYGTDEATASIVEQRCRVFFGATRMTWQLNRSDWDLLHWAARTHEIGMAISHKHYNRHSAYVLRNADLPGFSQDEQEQMAVLAQGHRGKASDIQLGALPESEHQRMRYLLAIMRLATRFKYVEQLEQMPEFHIRTSEGHLALEFPEGWLASHPLTASELEQESTFLRRLGLQLSIL